MAEEYQSLPSPPVQPQSDYRAPARPRIVSFWTYPPLPTSSRGRGSTPRGIPQRASAHSSRPNPASVAASSESSANGIVAFFGGFGKGIISTIFTPLDVVPPWFSRPSMPGRGGKSLRPFKKLRKYLVRLDGGVGQRRPRRPTQRAGHGLSKRLFVLYWTALFMHAILPYVKQAI